MLKLHPHMPAAAVALCAASIFAWFAGPGLASGFMPDDLMNLHRSARTPALDFLRGTFSPWAGEWRPFGFLIFKGLYTAFGFHPLPYHVLALGLLVVNAVLLTLLAWRLTGSGAATAFTALFICHHGYFSDLYLNSGTMFDTLAAVICLALVHSHLSQPRPGAVRLFLQLLFFLLALQIKEIAIFVPIALWGHEILIRRDRQAWRTAYQAWAYTGIACLFTAGLLWSGGEVMANPEYRPSLTPTVLLQHWEHYLANMFYQPADRGPVITLAILGTTTVAAWLARTPAALWAWLLAFTAPLPLLAVTPRSFYAFYVPFLFWALLAGILLARLTERWRWAPALLFVVLSVWLVNRHLWIQPYAEQWHRDATRQMQPALSFIPSEARAWPRGASILFHDDPYPQDDYTLLYVATLSTGDLTLAIHRTRTGANPASHADFHYQLSSERLTRLPAPPSP